MLDVCSPVRCLFLPFDSSPRMFTRDIVLHCLVFLCLNYVYTQYRLGVIFHLTLFGFRGYLSLVHNLMFYLYFSLELKHCICVACFTPPLHFLVLKTFSPLLIRILTCHINEPQRKLNPNDNDII